MKNIKIFLGILLFVGGVTGPAIIARMDEAQEQRLIRIMETQTSFDGETVDMLWNWRNNHATSAKFNDLYAEKIKDLPGWHYGE